MTAEYYSNIYKQYSTFMTDWNKQDHMFRVASGANSDDYHWTEVMMREDVRTNVQAIALLNGLMDHPRCEFVEADPPGVNGLWLQLARFDTLRGVLPPALTPHVRPGPLDADHGGAAATAPEPSRIS